MSIFDSWYYSKDYEQTYRPTMLYLINFYGPPPPGFTSTGLTSANSLQALDVAAGVDYNGQHYYARVVNANIGQLQMASGNGTDIFGSISLTLIDPDGDAYNWETYTGYQGATLQAFFVMYDPVSNQFSPDSKVIFEGMLDPADWDGTYTTLTATSTYSLKKSITPPVPFQRTCPWAPNFPATADQRASANGDPLSLYWNCGYASDQPNGRGNGLYTSCSGTLTDCQARGMYDTDSSGRSTKTFGAIQYTPPGTWKGKSYTAGKTLTGVNTINESKWSEYVPLTFGTTWSNGVCMCTEGDPNSTATEVVLGFGDYGINGDWVDNFRFVVVNGLLVPNSSQTSDLLFRWYGRTSGTRFGFIDPSDNYPAKDGGPFNPDPYGSMLMIKPVVYSQVGASNAPLDVRVLCPTRLLPVYTAPGQYTWEKTDLTAWVVYDLIRLARPDLYRKIDVWSVIHYSWACSQNLGYRRSDGTQGAHRRYGVSLTIDKKTSLAQVIEGLKIAGRLLIVPTDVSGSTMKFLAKQSLTDQQGGMMRGSNDNAGYSSMSQQGQTGVGFVAYTFTDSNMMECKAVHDKATSLPTVWTASIQDEDNNWIQDTVTVTDPDLYHRVNNLNTANIGGIGYPNYDQAYRTIKGKMAEMYRGNPKGDARGTHRYLVRSTFRGASVNLGDIVGLESVRMNQTWQLFRVEGIAPSSDFSTAIYSLRWHEDSWYSDRYGQQ